MRPAVPSSRLSPTDIAQLPAETEERAKYAPGLGSGPEPSDTPAAGKPEIGPGAALGGGAGLRPRIVTGVL
ncbi:hypothetical protein NDU88_005330 [Pleurodeles waltl]|uniref:Uncharacterized protein n=1 Tax=Pleurodeles waltl TaxID=8319 RepID=A0AAV7X0C9_PLEWA|nr:hypothetical protein NDU88_005330 [Pleurodeles waltl]